MPDHSKNQNPRQIHEDEIDLRELINVIIKRKKLILGIFLVSVIITAVIGLLTPKTYLTKAVIQIGVVDRPVFAIKEAEVMIRSTIFLSPIVKELGLKTEPSELGDSIKIEGVDSTNFMNISVEYQDKAKSYKLCRLIIDSFLSEAGIRYQQRVEFIKNQKNEIEGQLKSVETDINNTRKLINDLSFSEKASKTETGISIVFSQNTPLNDYSNLASLFEKKNSLESILFNSKESNILDISKPKPIKPNNKLNVVIAGIISLMLGIFLAFFMEFLQKSGK
jgi:capsular polysaccharide biosynthesis protein